MAKNTTSPKTITSSQIKEIIAYQKEARAQDERVADEITRTNDEQKKLGKLMAEAINAGNVGLQKELKEQRAANSKRIDELIGEQEKNQINAQISDAKNKEVIESLGFRLENAYQIASEKSKKFFSGYFGTAGDFKDKFKKIADIGNNISAGFKNIPGVKAIEDGIGSFFDIIKAGLLLVGGLVGLQGFLSGWEKATDYFGENASLGEKIAAGIAGIVQAFTGISDEQAKGIAETLAGYFEVFTGIVTSIANSFGRIIGLRDRTEDGADGLFSVLGDYLKMLALLVLYLGPSKVLGALQTTGKVLSALRVFMLTSVVPTVVAIGTSMMAALAPVMAAATAFLAPFLPFIVAVAAFAIPIGLIVLAIKSAADKVGGIGNLMDLAVAKLKDGFVNFVNSIATFINGLIEMIPYPFRPDFRVPLLEGGDEVAKVQARIDKEMAAEKESQKLEKEKADERITKSPGEEKFLALANESLGENAVQKTDAELAREAAGQASGTTVVTTTNAPTINNNTEVTVAPLMPQAGISSAYATVGH